jgi:hypothetical protein
MHGTRLLSCALQLRCGSERSTGPGYVCSTWNNDCPAPGEDRRRALVRRDRLRPIYSATRFSAKVWEGSGRLRMPTCQRISAVASVGTARCRTGCCPVATAVPRGTSTGARPIANVSYETSSHHDGADPFFGGASGERTRPGQRGWGRRCPARCSRRCSTPVRASGRREPGQNISRLHTRCLSEGREALA